MAQVPGPELFAKDPKTPVELWKAADYLIRTGQAKKAVPYLEKFQRSQPDDATLVGLRNRYGSGSFLRLDDDPATRPFVQPLVDALVAASRRYATDPDRVARVIAELTRSPEEQDYAVRRLREAGPHAVPFLVDALRRPGLSDGEREYLVRNMGRLEPSTVPAMAAALESPEPAVAAGVATVLGSIGDQGRAVLDVLSGLDPAVDAAVRTAASIARLTGRPFDQTAADPGPGADRRGLGRSPPSPRVPRRARPSGPGMLRAMPRCCAKCRPTRPGRSAACGLHGRPFGWTPRIVRPRSRRSAWPWRRPSSVSVRTRSRPRIRPPSRRRRPRGPRCWARSLRRPSPTVSPTWRPSQSSALAKVTDRTTLAVGGRLHPLARALTAPGRRVQFAAARSLVELAPDRPFPGSSLVAPVLARFIINQPQPRAVVIDGNANRGGRLAGLLMNLGYHHVPGADRQ